MAFRSRGMASFLDRANDWRRRAEELRTLADNMLTVAARSSLLDMAAALEHHAGNLEQTAGKFARARQAAAAVAHREHSTRQRDERDRGTD
jgi:hypothetical protein